MPIEQAEVLLLTAPVAEPRGPSCFTYHRRESVLVRLTDTDGVTGWGETFLRPGVLEAAAALGELCVGRDPLAAVPLWHALAGASQDACALSAVSIAVDDLRGRRLGVPVSALYGGAVRDRVRAYASSAGYAPDEPPEERWPEEVAGHLAEGFSAVKLRIGRYTPARELAVLERVRDETPADVELLVDANGAYALPRAIQVGRVLDRLGFGWYEEPLPRMQRGVWYAGYEELATALDIAVAAAEGLETRSAFHAFLQRGGADIVQPDVGSCGGIGEAFFVAQLAELHARRCVPHCWGGAVLIAATLQLLALLPEASEVPGMDSPLLELDAFENPMRTELTAEPFAPDAGGCIAIPSGPGLGIELDEERLRALSVPVAASA